MKNLLFVIAALVSLAFHSSAQSLTYTSIDVPGASLTNAAAINDGGAIVGRFIDKNGNSVGFLLSGGVFQYITPSGAISTRLRGINSQGDMVGDYVDVATTQHGFLLTAGGVLTVIDVPGAGGTVASGINDHGQVVGNYFDSVGEHGFIYKQGQITTFDLPNATFTLGFFVSNNNAGALVGTVDDATGISHAFLRRNGLVMNFNIPYSGTFTSAQAISSTGKIVGAYAFVAGRGHGFLQADGNITRIKFPEATSTGPRGINAHDQVVGSYTDRSGVQHGFMAQ